MAVKELSVEDKLKTLFRLQLIDSKVDEIETLRGELPVEVKDLEDELEGLQTRINKINEDIKDLEDEIGERKNSIKEAEALVHKYQEQQNNVKNSREYDALTKEIELQGLEMQLAEKKIKESRYAIESKKELLAESEATIETKKKDLEVKKEELDKIIKETSKEEDKLKKLSDEAKKDIEERLIKAYDRIRNNYKNGMAVVTIERNSCGGCFNKIPPQRQAEIALRKKVIVCEHCGRILVDSAMNEDVVVEL